MRGTRTNNPQSAGTYIRARTLCNHLLQQDHRNTTMMLLSLRVVFAVVCVLYGRALAGSNVTEATVAFTAALDADVDVPGGQTVVYNKDLLDFGGGYNNKTGVFTATKGGVYVFQIYALTKLKSDFWLELYHNNLYVISIFARQSSDYDAAGNAAILRLKKNDKVYVKTRRTAYLYGRKDQVYATFSGYRIGLLRDGDQ